MFSAYTMTLIKNNAYVPRTHFFAILKPMITHFYASVRRWLLNFIVFQLFISLMSLPLLIAWGLPLSLLSILGNGLFNPLLTFFLLLATLIFITEIVYLPNQWLCWLLEKTDTLFTITSGWATNSWLISIRQLPLPILFAIPLIGLWIITTSRLRTQGTRALALTSALIVIFAGAYLTSHSYIGECSSNKKNKTTLFAYADNTLAIFDVGMLATNFRYRTWWEYTLMPEIAKKTGKTTIDYLVILSPSERAIEGTTMITSITPIHNVIIVGSEKTLHALLHEIQTLFTSLKAQGVTCRLHAFSQESQPNLTDFKIEPIVCNSSTPFHQVRKKLTKKISYSLKLDKKSHIAEVKITCDERTLSIDKAADAKPLLKDKSTIDKQTEGL